MFGMGWGELVVLGLVGLFVLGPERLPGAIRWVADAVGQAKGYVAAAKDQLDSEQFAELRKPLDELREPLSELRSLDPRRSMKQALWDQRAPAPAPEPPSTPADPEPDDPSPRAAAS